MDPESFAVALKAFARRRPFVSFTVHFVDGDSLTVDQPEALVFRGGVAVYSSARGEPTLFDHRSVSRLSDALDAASAWSGIEVGEASLGRKPEGESLSRRNALASRCNHPESRSPAGFRPRLATPTSIPL